MSERWSITWMGEGVASNQAGVFGKHTTAFVDASFARRLVGEPGWIVVDDLGREQGVPPVVVEEKKEAPPKPAARPKTKARTARTLKSDTKDAAA